jgi:CheY-like chemotaxis protein
MMQERANSTNGEMVDPSTVDVEGVTPASHAQIDEASPFTMKSLIPSTERAATPTRVLICDDETRLVTLTAGLLRELGYDVLTVKSGEDAIDCVRREAVDIVVLDVNLPGEDTLAVARRLIQDKVPAIVLSSGFTEEDVESELLALPGVRAFLAKPYGIEALSTTIRSVLASLATK